MKRKIIHTNDIKDKARHLKDSGWSIYKISKEFGIDYSTVWYWFNTTKKIKRVIAYHNKNIEKYRAYNNVYQKKDYALNPEKYKQKYLKYMALKRQERDDRIEAIKIKFEKDIQMFKNKYDV